ncbi:MAG: hypothetical protein H6855_01325 [Rhodospirillales bacterium]|nr:hypothetical protein [Rhodospirillales bacterium]MCB9964711.1 hypothetical protein [Rhodospirillales bacterium]MCB9980065.1 hypothetical protein [Rhodospirillales bacterium]
MTLETITLSEPSRERGNVLFYILIGVALFAALSMAVSYSGQSGGGAITEEKASILASEVMETGERISSVLSKLRLRGCTLAQISFDNPYVSGYANGSAPSDESCHVFSIQGGELNWPTFSSDLLNQSWTGQPDFGKPIFTLKNKIPQLGTDGSGTAPFDLLMLVEGLNMSVCQAINKRLTGSTAINTADEVETKYNGAINAGGTYAFPATFSGQRQGCFEDNAGTDSGTLVYYYALMVR